MFFSLTPSKKITLQDHNFGTNKIYNARLLAIIVNVLLIKFPRQKYILRVHFEILKKEVIC